MSSLLCKQERSLSYPNMMYSNGLPDYYKMLHIRSTASAAEIKKAFRRRAKEIHPDIGNNSLEALVAMRDLLAAYEILIHDDLRRKYDIRHRIAYPKETFDYREFLQSRYNDPDSTGKLIFFDLLHDHEKEALDLYDMLVIQKGFDLSKHLDREDFMDCAFLLAEKYEEEGKWTAAFTLFRTLIGYELEHSYFRHFFREVLDRTRRLLLHKMLGAVPTNQYINYLQQIINMPIQEQEKTMYMKKVSELHLRYNNAKKITSRHFARLGCEGENDDE